MRRFLFAKLVRDKVVDQIVAAGNLPHWKTLTDKAYQEELKKKIVEEAAELPSAEGEEVVQELADIQEVIDNLLRTLHISKEELARIQEKKNKKAGSFKKRQYIDYVEAHDTSEWIPYYLKHPDKYPEIKK